MTLVGVVTAELWTNITKRNRFAIEIRQPEFYSPIFETEGGWTALPGS